MSELFLARYLLSHQFLLLTIHYLLKHGHISSAIRRRPGRLLLPELCRTFAPVMENRGKSSNRAVANWILIGVIMLLVQVILGGITRLTGSGLSITEWNVVTGALPPLSEQQWQHEFQNYRQTPQFRLLNADFNLGDFKFIFFWEWFHRFWARMVAVVFVVGLVYLLFQRKMKREMIRPLTILFLLGALQGAVGWIMVKSGLTGDAIYVKPTKLALHFVFALVLICYTFRFFLELRIPRKEIVRHNALHRLTWIILAVVFVQLIFGALMAGHKAANAAPTWPSINGAWLPSAIFDGDSFIRNLFGNKIMIQFVHRLLAYLLLLLTAGWTYKVFEIKEISSLLVKSRQLPVIIIFLQIILGIAALLTSPGIVPNHWVGFDWIAQLHQITGMLFLLIMIYMLFLVRRHRVSL